MGCVSVQTYTSNVTVCCFNSGQTTKPNKTKRQREDRERVNVSIICLVLIELLSLKCPISVRARYTRSLFDQ